MVAWSQFEASEPDFATRVRRIFDAHLHKTMATLRADGSPRISGTELTFGAGEVWLGTMPAARKAQDLLRDPRIAVHSAPIDTKMIDGDAKLSARAIHETNPDTPRAVFPVSPPGAAFFRLDIHEVVLTRVVDSKTLLVEIWKPSTGLRTITAA